MAKLQTKSIFVCRECGADTPRWEGRCPQCSAWNSLEEMAQRTSTSRASATSLESKPPRELTSIDLSDAPRTSLQLKELDRVLGGGVVPGSLVLVGGEPGIGKSTLLLQAAAAAAEGGKTVLYASGEESEQQVRLRADRLGVQGRGLYVQAASSLDAVLQNMDRMKPSLVIIDSIQTVFLEDSTAPPGSLSQIREATWRLLEWSKATNVPVFITGHVTKEGAIAGPRMLEHMVDVVLYMEGEPYSPYRMLRGTKNRFGSTNEVGVLEMGEKGLADVLNPSQALLSERAPDAVGSAVTATLEGTRPILVEIQALTSLTSFNLPRRIASGIDQNRLLLVTAILSKRLGARLANQDVIANVVGGLRIWEPATDLALALAIVSSLRDRAIEPGLIAVGELGLSGEVRSVSQLGRRLQEAAHLGLRKGIIPRSASKELSVPKEMELVKVATLSEAVRVALLGKGQAPQEEA